jgi:hypothetical protein
VFAICRWKIRKIVAPAMNRGAIIVAIAHRIVFAVAKAEIEKAKRMRSFNCVLKIWQTLIN